MKKLCLALFLILLISSFSIAEGNKPYQTGDKIEDFSVSLPDGGSVSLYDILKEKDMVLINLWATWCGSCVKEFPAMEKAYQRYKDDVEILALSTEAEDTLDVIGKFKADKGLSFVMSQDSKGLFDKFALEAIPASIVVDRFGTVCYIGSYIPDEESFSRLFDAFTGDDYEESVLLDAVPPVKPNLEASKEEEIFEAIHAKAKNPDDGYTWPMVVSEKDGRSVIVSSNALVALTTASVTVQTEAKAGDAVQVAFKISSEAAGDIFRIDLNGEEIKMFSGVYDWRNYSVLIEEDGQYEITLSYTKDPLVDYGDDCVWIDYVRVLSGEEAEKALNDNPVYPFADQTEIIAANENAEEVIFDDPMGLLSYAFGDVKYYLIDSETVTVSAKLSKDVDPEGAFFTHMFENTFFAVTDYMKEDGYEITRPIASIPESVIPFTAVRLSLDPAAQNTKTVIAFKDEANIEEFIAVFGVNGWSYKEEAYKDTNNETAAEPREAAYTILCVDQDGTPVEGVMIQICDEVSCRAEITNAEGTIQFTSEPCSWEIHVLMAPDGYKDASGIVYAPFAGGEIVLKLDKTE